MLADRSQMNTEPPKVHAMNTNFFSKLQKDYSFVKCWTNKVDVFSFDIVLVPVHETIHWSIAIINLKNKTVEYYNPMGSTENLVFSELIEYMKSESIDKKQTAFDTLGWSFGNVQDIPKQSNGSDCGVFCCMYAEFITRNQHLIFTQQDMIHFRMKMIYEIFTGKMLT